VPPPLANLYRWEGEDFVQKTLSYIVKEGWSRPWSRTDSAEAAELAHGLNSMPACVLTHSDDREFWAITKWCRNHYRKVALLLLWSPLAPSLLFASKEPDGCEAGRTVLKLLNLHMAWIRYLRVCSHTVMTVSFERSLSGVEITTEKLHYNCCDPLLLHHYCLHPKSRTDSLLSIHLLTIAVIRSWEITKWCRIQ